MNIHTYLSTSESSLYKLAKQCGVQYTTLKELVAGKRKIENLPGKTILSLARGIGCSMEDIMNMEFSNDTISITSYATKSDYYKYMLKNYKNVILAFDSALEFYKLSNDNSSRKVYCYSVSALPEPFIPVIVNNFSNIDYQTHDGILVTSIDQTFNDLIADDNSDTQPIYEALNHYYYEHDNSFESLNILPQNSDRFLKLAEESLEYYAEG